MKEIKRSTERVFWILIIVAVVGFFYFVPNARSFKNSDEADYYDKLLKTALQYLNDYYVDADKVKLKDLYYGAIQGMYTATGDPYTTMLEPKHLKGLMESIQGEFEGIGAYVGMKDNRVVIISPIDGTPAYRIGIKPGDIIMKIEDKDTEGMKLEEAVSRLRGPANTKVKVSVYRKGLPDYLNFVIERKKIEIPSVRSTIIEPNIGYVKIINFSEHTADELESALASFNEKKIKKLIVDLRYNPGGALDSVVEIADFFLNDGLVVYTVGKKAEETKKFYATNKDKIAQDIPMVVLVNKGSASASEIFAGAMKDRKRGIVIGEKTFGKGSVQNIQKILDREELLGLKITIAKFYTPGGYVIEGNGIEPEIKVDMPKMSPEEEIFAAKILEEKLIEKFVEKNPDTISEKELEKLKKQLADKGMRLKDIFLKKLIREEQNSNKSPRIVDLDYDTQLRRAIEELNKKN